METKGSNVAVDILVSFTFTILLYSSACNVFFLLNYYRYKDVFLLSVSVCFIVCSCIFFSLFVVVAFCVFLCVFVVVLLFRITVFGLVFIV